MKPDPKKWKIFLEYKNNEITNWESFINIIKRYGCYNINQSMCHPLRNLFEKLSKSEVDEFYSVTYPFMISLASEYFEIFKEDISPLLKQKTREVSFTKRQCACILSNAFFCTFPDERPHNLPYINFINLYTGGKKPYNTKVTKLRMILEYFTRLAKENIPDGVVTFRRDVILDFPSWNNSKDVLISVKSFSEGTIEDNKHSIQVDFANKIIGGGVLNYGCVQEEIRFCISPESLISRYLCETLSENESVSIIGTERYSNYTGYANSTLFSGSHFDDVEVDEKGRKKTIITAIDAIHFYKPEIQYQSRNIYREINKAYVGFLCENHSAYIKDLPISTGNWGCGAFNGDRSLKFFIQLIAATAANRQLLYYTFGDVSLSKDIERINSHFQTKKVTIRTLVYALTLYTKYKKGNESMFDYIERTVK